MESWVLDHRHFPFFLVGLSPWNHGFWLQFIGRCISFPMGLGGEKYDQETKNNYEGIKIRKI